MIELLVIAVAATHLAGQQPVMAASDRCETLSAEMVRQCARGHWPDVIQIFGRSCDRATRRFEICERKR
jgi:hypothetical protein